MATAASEHLTLKQQDIPQNSVTRLELLETRIPWSQMMCSLFLKLTTNIAQQSTFDRDPSATVEHWKFNEPVGQEAKWQCTFFTLADDKSI